MGSQSVLDFLVAYDLPGIDDNGFSKRKKALFHSGPPSRMGESRSACLIGSGVFTGRERRSCSLEGERRELCVPSCCTVISPL